MNIRTIYAVILGIVLYSLYLYITYIEQTLRVEQLLLIIITPLLVGILSGSSKAGTVLGFVLPLGAFTVEAAIFAWRHPNVMIANVVSSLFFVAISVGLGALGGLIGKRIRK